MDIGDMMSNTVTSAASSLKTQFLNSTATRESTKRHSVSETHMMDV